MKAKLSKDPKVLLVDGTGIKIYGAGEWLRSKHKIKDKAQYRRLTIMVDYESGQIVSHTLMPSEGQGTGEVSQVAPLLEMLPDDTEIKEVIFDRLFDSRKVYQTVGDHGGLPIIIPPFNGLYGVNTHRDDHLKTMNYHGEAELKARLDYGRRSLVETAIPEGAGSEPY